MELAKNWFHSTNITWKKTILVWFSHNSSSKMCWKIIHTKTYLNEFLYGGLKFIRHFIILFCLRAISLLCLMNIRLGIFFLFVRSTQTNSNYAVNQANNKQNVFQFHFLSYFKIVSRGILYNKNFETFCDLYNPHCDFNGKFLPWK